jgi:hypothetical protein
MPVLHSHPLNNAFFYEAENIRDFPRALIGISNWNIK